MRQPGPKYLFDCMNEVRRRIRRCRNVALFLDLDGTLASITLSPKLTRLEPEKRLLLKTLSAATGYNLVIVSGRELQDLKQIVKLPDIIYVGNHGLEISGPETNFIHEDAAARCGVIAQICSELEAQLQIKGMIIEFKRLSASVHYRALAASEVSRVRSAVEASIKAVRDQVYLTEGKKVFELRPRVSWDKGSAVRWILNRAADEVVSVYIGDDRTDEDAFAALPDSITIKVGACPVDTSARYFVRCPDGVLAFLQYLPLIKHSSTAAVPNSCSGMPAAARD